TACAQAYGQDRSGCEADFEIHAEPLNECYYYNAREDACLTLEPRLKQREPNGRHTLEPAVANSFDDAGLNRWQLEAVLFAFDVDDSPAWSRVVIHGSRPVCSQCQAGRARQERHEYGIVVVGAC